MTRTTRVRAALVPLIAAWLAACEPMPEPVAGDVPAVADVAPPDDDGAALPDANFAAPEGLAVAGDFLVVANARYGYDGQGIAYGTGFATVVDRATGRVVNRIPMPAKNPQAVAVAGDRVWVLCSGQTSFDGTLVTPLTGGALAGIRIADLAVAEAPDAVVDFPLDPARPLVGYPSSLAILGDRAWMGSGTAAALFVADLASGTRVRGADDPILLGDADAQDTLTVAAGSSGHLLAASFNRDLVWVLDATDGAPLAGMPFEVGVPGGMDGVLALAWREGGTPNLYVLLGMASRVAAATLGDGAPRVTQRFATTGSLPNALLLDGDRLLVLNSGDNNVRAFDVATGGELAFTANLPPSANPYAMAVGDVADGRRLYVTGLMANAVYVFDASPGVNPGATRTEIR